MADFKSSLPIRTEVDADEKVQVKLHDFTDPDGTDKQVEVSEKLLHTRMFAKDDGGTKREVKLSEEGHVITNGDYDGTSNSRPSSSAIIAHDRAASPGEAEQNVRPTGIASTDGDNAKALDVAIRDSQGNHIDEENPLAIYMAESPADEVDDFNDSGDIAKDASANHDYTVTAGKDLKAIEAFVGASGRTKVELKVETGVATGVFNAVATSFITTARPDVTLKYAKKVAAGVKVRVTSTNIDNQPFAAYSQIKGLEI